MKIDRINLKIEEINKQIKELEEKRNKFIEKCNICGRWTIGDACIGCDVKKIKDNLLKEIDELKKKRAKFDKIIENKSLLKRIIGRRYKRRVKNV